MRARDLMPRIYEDLRRLAAREMSSEREGHTLQTTALVHEVYLRLARDGQDFENLRHFYGAAARAMRRILVDHARARNSLKRGGGRLMVEFDSQEQSLGGDPDDILLLDDSVSVFCEKNPDMADLVHLRIYAGLGIEEAAGILGIGRSTAFEHWAFARASLLRLLEG